MTCPDCVTVKESVKDALVDSTQGFHGIGVGSRFPDNHPDGHMLNVYVEPDVRIPATIQGIITRKVTTGPFSSLGIFGKYPTVHTLSKYPTVRTLDTFVRPVSGGNSVGAYSNLLKAYVTGTVGMAFQSVGGQLLILSNNHILCAIDTVQRGGAVPGTAVFQPGVFFGGSPGADTFASLYQWGKIDETHVNQLDWATALVTDPTQVSPDILNVGTPAVIIDLAVGMQVAKMGALSGLTRGSVIDVNASIDVNYEGLFTTSFDNQVIVQGPTPFGSAGDSGSIVVSNVGGKVAAGGLLFSGSDTLAVLNKLSLVQQVAGLALPLATVQQTAATTGGYGTAVILTFIGAAAAFLTRKQY